MEMACLFSTMVGTFIENTSSLGVLYFLELECCERVVTHMSSGCHQLLAQISAGLSVKSLHMTSLCDQGFLLPWWLQGHQIFLQHNSELQYQCSSEQCRSYIPFMTQAWKSLCAASVIHFFGYRQITNIYNVKEVELAIAINKIMATF